MSVVPGGPGVFFLVSSHTLRFLDDTSLRQQVLQKSGREVEI